jgi:alpha-glucosidase
MLCHKTTRVIIACAVLLMLLSTQGQARTGASLLRSPSGQIEVRVATAPLEYSVQFKGRPVILNSPLGLAFRGAADVSDWKVLRASQNRVNRTWQPTYGKSGAIRDYYQELDLQLGSQSEPSRRLELQIRAFEDGVAFRYVVPKQPNLESFVLSKELTGFHFEGDPAAWVGTTKSFHHSYEQEYPERKLSSLNPSEIVVLPMLVRTQSGVYAAITESNLSNWAGMYLKRDGQSMAVDLSPRLDGQGLVKGTAPQVSPWRVLMLAETAGKMIESNLVEQLNPPSRIADTSWIKPGMMAWDHWWSGDVKMDNETNKRFIAFAGKMGFPYQLIDWQWYGRFDSPQADITRPAPQIDLPGLIQYARERGVREWLWLHSNDVNRYKKQGKLDDAFATYERWGIAGVKIDFMDSNDQEMVQWYEDVLATAARHHLMVDYHGAYIPTGLHITWPKRLTREGVMGNEYNRLSRVTPVHKVTLAYTRLLAGPMDYTPGGFLNRSPEEWKRTQPTQVMGSRAQELALFVVYWSPLMCVSDDPVHYQGQPGLEFLREVPTVWDETRFLQGEVAQDLVLARRKGARWFLGAMTADKASQRTVSLSFLGKGQYRAHIFADPADANASYESLAISTREVTATDSLELKMRPAGGAAVYFVPVK